MSRSFLRVPHLTIKAFNLYVIIRLGSRPNVGGQDDPSQQLRRALTRIIEAGYQVEPETLAVMRKLAAKGLLEEAVEGAMEKAIALEQRPLFLPRSFLEPREPEPEPTPEGRWESTSTQPEVYAKQVEGRIEILEDPGKEAGATRNTRDLLEYFRDRFSKISRILRQRSDARDAITLEEALKAPPRTRNRIICIVTEKRERPRSLALTVEDMESQATLIVPSSSDRSVLEKARSLFLDQVACVEVSRTQGETLIAHDFLNPDIPERPVRGSEEELYVALLSDLHIGSQKFLPNSFDKFLSWLRGEFGDEKIRRIASRVKYLVIAGDLVDGIGVYPGQERELEIGDIHQQYSEAAKVLLDVPEYIHIILIPGNHDATAQALPQPALSERYAGDLLDHGNVTSLGNPATVRLNGVETLIYHGRSLDDVVGTVPGVTYQNLDESITMAMRSLVRVRHLAPIYGARTPIIPQGQDHLVIERPPDILHCGHVHVAGYELYRGTLLLNSGTWQAQTEYQERMGLVPTPGIATIVNLKNLAVVPLKFTS